ncbi:MAG: hypothetical protein WC480_02530 [Patescibacteria group bacterium]
MAEEKKVNSVDQKDIDDNKIVAALSYFWVLCLVPLLSKKESKFAQFHAKQGLILFALEVVCSLVWFLLPLFTIVFVVVSIIGIVKVLNGEYWKMPIIGNYAEKINL